MGKLKEVGLKDSLNGGRSQCICRGRGQGLNLGNEEEARGTRKGETKDERMDSLEELGRQALLE